MKTEALHESTHLRPLQGGEPASVRLLSVPLLGGVSGGLIVPRHTKKQMEALHEPWFRLRRCARLNDLSSRTSTRTSRLMVSTHAKNRNVPFHESPAPFNRSIRWESGAEDARTPNADASAADSSASAQRLECDRFIGAFGPARDGRFHHVAGGTP